MNGQSFFTVLVVAVVLACATSLPNNMVSSPKKMTLYMPAQTRSITSTITPLKQSNDLCNLCIQFTGEAINVLLNIILNEGIIGGCSKLCAALAQKTGSQTLGAVCDILCDVVGIEDFIKYIEQSDLDPIYFCELLHSCPVNDHGDAKIVSFTVSPASGPQGTTFQVALEYKSVNGTGTGEIDLFLHTVDGIPVGDDELLEASKPGTYSVSWKVHAAPDPSCDPTQQECEMWFPGNYTFDLAICNGECGSKHPHSAIYDSRSLNFTITN